MNKNVGGIDKILRFVVGAACISLVFIGPQSAWGWIGVPLILTSFISFCPLYPLLGFSSAKK